MKAKKSIILSVIFISVLFFSCQTVKPPVSQKEGEITISRSLRDKGILSAAQLAAFFMSVNPDADRATVERLSGYYIAECRAEGINSDCAFAQMCHETGYLKFGNLVVPEMHNYCGLGAMDAEHPGEWFDTEELGVRAHVQHLQAYATTEDVPLNQPLVDPRYSWVHKTKYAPTIFELTGTWATDPLYGEKLDQTLTRMEISAER